MAYNRPNAFTRRVFNPIALRFGISGSKRLTVPRRRSGEPQSIPVIPVEHGGVLHIVSTRGESDWVRNLRAGGNECELDGTPYAAAELAEEQRSPVIDAYRAKAGRAVEGYWKKLPDAADHPVFRLSPHS